MVGGEIVQVIHKETETFIEVLDANEQYVDRCWRVLDRNEELKIGGLIWWQLGLGYYQPSKAEMSKRVGRCNDSHHPDSKRCEKCGDVLKGHEDDSDTRCRWCIY